MVNILHPIPITCPSFLYSIAGAATELANPVIGTSAPAPPHFAICGYRLNPVKYDKGLPISGLEEFDRHEGYYCFHAGTKFNGDQIVTNGGRVLGVTAKGKDLKEARANAYAATEWVKFDNKYMRHDIGKAIDEA